MSASATLLPVLLSLAYASSTCQWTDPSSHAVFDLSSLSGHTVTGLDLDGTNYVYTMQPCADSREGPCGHAGATLNQAKNGACVSPLAFWRNPHWALLDASAPSKGVALQLLDGPKCNFGNRETTINFRCMADASEQTFTVTETAGRPCHYTVDFPTPHACPVSEVFSASTLTHGWTLVILTAVLSSLYVGGGIAYNKRMHSLEGMDAIPNLEFWKQFPGLVKDGGHYAWAKIQHHRHGATAKDYPGL